MGLMQHSIAQLVKFLHISLKAPNAIAILREASQLLSPEQMREPHGRHKIVEATLMT